MSSNKIAYCSWCFEKTEHRLVVQNTLRRNRYECNYCHHETLECRYCPNMSKGGKWDNELCAEHDGSIASFDSLTLQLDDISDYEKIFKRNSYNLQKGAKIAAFSLGGAAVLGPLALAAAPAIGGAYGAAVLGFSGAVAESAGLAAIGGGAIAANGLGMAGGAAIIGAVGAALGGVSSGVISNSYFQEVKGFKIEKIKSGTGPKILFIDGFLTENTPAPDDWNKALALTYPDNPWYYVRWESKRLLSLGKNLSGHGGQAVAQKFITKWAKQAAKQAAKKIGPIGWIATALGIVSNPWSVATIKAGQTGVLLAVLIARTKSDYILFGHSLGARVIYYCLECLKGKSDNFIADVHLLGGAVGNNSVEWEKTGLAVKGKINNYYSSNDWILATFYKAGTFFASTPIGRNPIQSNTKTINNVDVTDTVSGHTKHKENLHKFCIR